MRLLESNKRTYHYANPIKTEEIKDEWGNLTSEIETLYETPTRARGNYSASKGEETIAVFGTFTDYSRVIVYPAFCPVKEGCRLWIGVAPPDEANYVVKKIADSVNGTMVAIKELI